MLDRQCFLIPSLLAGLAGAVEIDFAKGYGGGDLDGQHGWKLSGGKAEHGLVIADGALRPLIPAVDADRAAFYLLSADRAVLGGVLDPAASTVAFRMRLRFDEAPVPTGGSNADLLRVWIGGRWQDAALGFEVLANGRIAYPGADRKAVRAKGGDGKDFIATAGAWIEIAGSADYAAKSWRLDIAGVNQDDGAGRRDIAFINPAVASADVVISNRLHHDVRKAIAIGGLSVGVVPAKP